MVEKYSRQVHWDFFSRIILSAFSVLQVIRWMIMPQFMDIYYHLLTAWGFLRSGGYTGWDFWQYAPVGRIHIYPPFFHLMLAALMKFGISPVILAKIFETFTPIIFLFIVWYFVRKNYGERLAFFAVVVIGSSFSFYINLINHLPATLAIIFGILAFDQLLGKKMLRATLLLVLCFYTHIGMSFFFIISVALYGLFNREQRRLCFTIFICALIISAPVILKQLSALKYTSGVGSTLQEKYICQFKLIEYLLAFCGIIFIFKLAKTYRVFISFFIAAFIFLLYPYRFFSAEGYLPIVFLAAVSIDALYNKFIKQKPSLKYVLIAAIVGMIILSPSVLMDKSEGEDKVTYEFTFAHSAFLGMIFPTDRFYTSIWFPNEYLSAASVIKNNTEQNDIIYSTMSIVGVCLGSISERSTANGLFPEIGPSRQFDPLASSKVIIFTKNDDTRWISDIAAKYQLVNIGENKIFYFYKNPFQTTRVAVRKASVPFSVIILISLIFLLLFFGAEKIEKIILPRR